MSDARQPTLSFLAELNIRDFAIVDTLHIEWVPGLNVLTGETGAGKSIIVDALGAVFGDRAVSDWIRAGAVRASVEAIVVFPAEEPVLDAALAEMGADSDEGQLIIARDVQSGRSVSRVNGRAVPVSAVQQLADRLVDVHSQASHLSLLRVKEHVIALDRYAHAQPLRTEMGQAVRELQVLRGELRNLEEGERQAEREAVLLRHEIEEIDAVEPQEHEEDELAAQRGRLRNAQRLRQLGEDAHDALHGGEEGRGAIDLLGVAVSRLAEIAELDPASGLGSDRLLDLLDAAEEVDRSTRRYADEIEDDPAALDVLEERLLTLAALKRKYGPSLGDVLRYRADAALRLDAVEHREERIAALTDDVRQQEEAVGELAVRLSKVRTAAADELATAVEHELADLGMGGTRFLVQIDRVPDPHGLPVRDVTMTPTEDRVAFDETGIDQVEFLFSANPGEPPRGLARIASGGELARFMLALKSVLSAVDDTPILIFDELDQGVGGRMGHVIGEKLWELARRHHVLCITHLPQVASYADAHYVVVKGVDEGRTRTSVNRLDTEQRANELALMLAGPGAGPAARRSAEELLSRAAAWKGEGGTRRGSTGPTTESGSRSPSENQAPRGSRRGAGPGLEQR